MAVVIDEMEVVPREREQAAESPEKAPGGAGGADVARRVEKFVRDLAAATERLRAY